MKIVLVIPYRGIGDLIFHLPLIRGLSKKYYSKINILTNKVNKAKILLKNELSINKVEYISFQREKQIKNSYLFLKKINSFHSDICILTAPSKRLIIPLKLSNSKNKIYFKKSKTRDLSKYIIEQSKKELKDVTFLNDYSLNFRKNKLREKNIFISIDSRHDSNDWHQKYYIKLVEEVLKKKSIKRIYLNFDPSKVKAFKKVLKTFKSQKKIVFTYSTKFDQLISIMNSCLYIVGNESGPVCIGAALRKKVFSMYYPKHTPKSSKTINIKVKYFNTDKISSQKIIFEIIRKLK